MEGAVQGTDAASVSAGHEVEEFANALDESLSPLLSQSEKRERILNLPRKYHQNALRRLARLRPKHARSSHDDVDMDTDDHETATDPSADSDAIKRLEKEIQTWDLVRRLLPLRHSTAEATPSNSGLSKPGALAKQDAVRDFFLTDTVAQERRAVLQWLQNNAKSGPSIDEMARDLQRNADRGDIIAHGWLHTRTSIKLRKGLTAWPHLLDKQSPSIAQSHVNSDGAPLVTQLDPDAVTRQGRKLEPQDEYFERAIWLGCFQHLRRGSSFQVIQEWCQERTELWRAISLSAMLLPDDNKDSAVNADPAALALWRRMCFALARQGGSDDYERAVYGALSGDITSVETVAKTWDDFMFANYNALLRTQLDTFILSRCPADAASAITQSFSSFDAIQFHGERDTLESRLVRSLEERRDTREEAMEPSKALQAALIAKDVDRHLYEQGLVMTNDANEPDRSLLLPCAGTGDIDILETKFFKLTQRDNLRVVTHVHILNALVERLNTHDGTSTPPDWRYAQESIVAGYTEYLRLANLQELIPLYCSVLGSPRRYEVLSWNLIHERDPKERLTQLKLIKKSGIDVLRFVETQAWLVYEELNPDGGALAAKDSFSIIEKAPPTSRHGRGIRADFFGDEDGAIEPKHEHVIRSLEWLLLVDETWPKVFSVGTKAYKFFLKNMHLNAARRLMERVPFSEIMRDMADQEEGEGAWYDDLEFWSQQLIRSEIRDVRPGQVMADARNFRELEALVKGLDGLETMASLVEISQDMLPSNRDFWSKAGDEIKATKESMQPLLGNWLMTGIQEGDEELRDLRQAYLPETVLAYVSALHFAGTGLSRDNLLECMELAAVIAEGNSDLAQAFCTAGRMTELVEAFAACSKALAISTGEKRTAGSSSKKLREMGWSRDLWSVRSG